MPLWTAFKPIAPYPLRTGSSSPHALKNSSISYSSFLYTRRMARLTGKALAEDIANTVLEDSEPERQAEESTRKQQERHRREQQKRNEETGPDASDQVAVVVASISSPLFISKVVEPSVIEIGDTTSGALEGNIAPTNAPRHDSISSQSSEQEIQEILIKSPQSHRPTETTFAHQDNMPIDLAACIITSPADPESLVPRLDIARFAFGKKTVPKTAPKLGYALSRQLSHSSTSEENVPATKAPKTKPLLPSFASSFTTSQLAALSKCFVCNLAWTVRKTIPVKMSHIKACGRKNGWLEETIVARMTKEIGHISSTTGSDALQNSKTSKGKGKAVADQTPKTFLEDVVNDAAPKKRRKKAQDLEVVTVLKPQDAHAAIMERAKALLGPPAANTAVSAQEEVDSFPTTQIFPPSKLGAAGPSLGVLGLGMLEDQTTRLPSRDSVAPRNNVRQAGNSDFPPSTQTFPPSALAGKLAKRSMLYGDENDNGESLDHNDTTRLPPATQTFRPSALSANLGQSRPTLLDIDGTSTSAYRPTIDNLARPSKSLEFTKPLLATRPLTLYNAGAPSTSTSVSDERYRLPATSQKRLTDLNRRLAEIPTGGQDGKVQLDPYSIMSSEPVLSKRAQATREINKGEHESMGQSVSNGKKKARDRSSSSSRSRPRSRSRSTSRQPHSRRKSRSPTKQRMPEEECGDNYLSETLDIELNRIIKEDKVLYERILRYEPIHFDVFSNLAGIQKMDSKGFKPKLRAFLDRQAINFYGDSAFVSNRRRYK
ncbi:hypothetical protein JB92DRAFT_3142213 [Gautieria morchelliformis]|nr:hypothetical protein JB92DRAFT_3142213 [Gautieria morchelliformis]